MDMKYKLLLSASIMVFLALMPLSVDATPTTNDADGDGLIDRFELVIGSNPGEKDSDKDGWPDRGEVFNGYDPSGETQKKLEVSLLERDSDGDGLSDYMEANIATDHLDLDSDDDGYIDGLEIQYGFSPLDPGPNHYGKRIEVNKDRQTLSYFVGPHHVNTILISSGGLSTPTPVGEYKVEKKLPVHLYAGADYYLPNTKWNLLFKYNVRGNYYIHGAYWHNNFGKRMSHGCVNVSYDNMEHLYNWADIGTPIKVS
ncbi:MAG: hypothetical protein CMI52_03490 [Parcubacteria group bacterium]|nr:hypothetical protein [Parcubacteria group bacterium]